MPQKYNLIYADPPWEFRSKRSGGNMKSGAASKYPVMSIDDLKQMPINEIAAKDCVLIMWWVGSQPQEAIDLATAWGFKIKTMTGFVWNKQTKTGLPFFGMGYWTRAGSECALIAVRGKPKPASHGVRSVRSAKVGKHSAKPPEFRDDAVTLCGNVPRVELFARTATPGWDVFGNEIESTPGIAEVLAKEAA